MTEQTRYESFEIELCQQDSDGIAVVDNWRDWTQAEVNAFQADEEAPVFWTVYGRKPNGEVDAIADSTDRERADHIMALLQAGATVQRPQSGEPYHYYVTTVLNWVVDGDLGAAIDKARKVHKGDIRNRNFKCQEAYVFLVPLPLDANYEINRYVPQVEGVQHLGTIKI